MTQLGAARALEESVAKTESVLLRDELWAVFSGFARSTKASLIVAAPFITRNGLDAVLRDVALRNVLVVTTWKTEDVLRHASDIRIYPLLRSRGWTLRLHPTLHAKLIVRDLSSAIISTANVTELGLGLVQPSNTECAVTIDQLSSADQCWILNLVLQSMQVTDAYFSGFAEHVASITTNRGAPAPEFDPSRVPLATQPDLISLPVSRSPKWLVSRLQSIRQFGIASVDHEALRDVLHDASLFSLRVSASSDDNLQTLRQKFFALPLIKPLQTFVRNGRYFGEIKAWMRTHWNAGPPPTHEQLTRVVQVLFAWFVELGENQYSLTRPNHSQRLAAAND